MAGLVVDGGGFELVVGGDRVGVRRRLESSDVELLEGIAGRYVRAVQADSDSAVFLGIGRDLYRWLDGERGQLHALIDRSPSPLVFEVQGPRSPSKAAWAVLRAPFELLADPDWDFQAGDPLTRFCVVRRLGPASTPPALDGLRLGVVFMASAPRGQQELE